MKRWQVFAFLGPWTATVAAASWMAGVVHLAASQAPQAAYKATVILPDITVHCSAGADGLVFWGDATGQSTINLDCSADRLFANGFQAN